MKTTSEIKFDKIVKEGFYELLKQLGFKKKANNFYLQLDGFGQIINVQKSASGNRENISFTINVGIFISEYWLVSFNYSGRGIPDFPTEPECLIRQRIGSLKNQDDTWYDVKEETDEQQLLFETKRNLTDFILPYFHKLNSIEKILKELENVDVPVSPLGKLIIYAEFKNFEKAKREYEQLLNKKTSLNFLTTVKEYGRKYKLDR